MIVQFIPTVKPIGYFSIPQRQDILLHQNFTGISQIVIVCLSDEWCLKSLVSF